MNNLFYQYALSGFLGGDGTSDYSGLSNKPRINGVEVSGDKTSTDYGIGNPTDEQVASGVESYLNAHPEATTTVVDGSISTAKLADGAVSAQKAGFLAFDGNTVNLFDKSTVTDESSMAYWSVISAKSGYSVSDFIPVEENTVYCRSADTFDISNNNDTSYTVFYDTDKKRFEDTSMMYHRHSSADVPSFTTPEGCAYVRFTLPTTAKDTAMLVKGESVPAAYVPYGSYFTLGNTVRIYARSIQDLDVLFASIPDGTINTKMLADDVRNQFDSVDEINAKINVGAHQNDASWVYQTLSGRINVFKNTWKGILNINTDVSEQTVIIHGVNYFNVDDLVPGNLMFATGQINTEQYTLSEHLPYFIPIEPGKTLYWNRDYALREKYCTLCYGFYDAEQTFISEGDSGGAYYGTITVPENAYFMRICLKNFGTEPINYKAEKIQISDIDLGNTYNGYGSENSNLHYGRVLFFPYIGYRIENGVLAGASETFVLEDVTHVSIYDAASTIEVTAPVKQTFDRERLNNVVLKYGRHADTDYVLARIFKTTITGDTIKPKVVAFSPGGKRLAEYAKEADFVMAVNAGIFDTSNNSCYGTTIVDGTVITDHVDAGTCGMGAGLAIDSSGNFSSHAYDTTTADLLAAGVVHAVHGWGVLVSDYAACDIEQLNEDVTLPGKTPDLFPVKHPRAAVGQYKNGDYMVFVCGGRETNQAGMTGAETQALFLSEGVKFAYMLDGGGSCNMMFFKKELAPYTEGRADSSYIVFN